MKSAEEILEDEEKRKDEEQLGPKVPLYRLFRFASGLDLLLVFTGILASIATGISLPLLTLFFKDLIDDGFGGGVEGVAASKVRDVAFKFLYISLGLLFAGALSNACCILAAANQGTRIRREYFKAVLRQEIGWFDTTKTGEIVTSIERDCYNIQNALGDKIVFFVHNVSTFLGGIIMGFVNGWMMAACLCAALPVLAVAAAWMASIVTGMSTQGERAYRAAGGVAEQAISGIRTVASICGEEREQARYAKNVITALNIGLAKAKLNGLGIGTFLGCMIGMYALGLWFGSWLIINKKENDQTGEIYTGGDVILVFFSVLMGSFSIGQVLPAWTAFQKGQASAMRVYEVIDRIPAIDPTSDSGAKPTAVQGHIQLQQVAFTYPARPDAQVFQNLNLNIKPGQSVALVGSSGSGKSTVVQLILRFYDPTSGTVSLDGVSLRDLNVKWLRDAIGLVSQEPVLFAVSILENIRYGKKGATLEEAQKACQASNAHNFIAQLPDGYNTLCGERGTQLSGGQKQRIAIARAIISDPKILLLDEATSALDSESEKLVQAALDDLMTGRTTVIVAHRLSTIVGADQICVFRSGEIVEQGTHQELMQSGPGHYKELISKQLESASNEDQNKTELEDVPILEKNRSSGIHSAQGDAVTLKRETSEVKTEEEKKKEEAELVAKAKALETAAGKSLASRAMEMNAPEWPYGVMGFLGSALNGSIFPVLAILLVEMLSAYFQCIPMDPSPRGHSEVITFYDNAGSCSSPCVFDNSTNTLVDGVCSTANSACCWNSFSSSICAKYKMEEDEVAIKYWLDEQECYDDMSDTVQIFALAFLGLTFAAFLANFTTIVGFDTCGQNLCARYRQLAFAALMKQEIGFFDYKEHSTGALCNKLAKEATYIEGAVGNTIGTLIQLIVLMGISLGISFARGWMMALICFSTVPLMAAGQALQFQFIAGAGGDSSKAYSEADGIASEAIGAVRTVAAFSAERKVEELFLNTMHNNNKAVQKTAIGTGIGQGVSLFVMFFIYFTGFAGGAHLMENHGYTFQDVMQVFFSITFLGAGMGNLAALGADIPKAKPALVAIYELLDRVPLIESDSDKGEKTTIKGQIELKNVTFRYPARMEALIFDNLNLSIGVGQTVALVGSSGSGKSTVISLIERFYDPLEGQVLIDGVDIKSFNLKHLRRQIGLVSQEPVLFATSIAENIRYGKEDATVGEIEAAAEQANALDFVLTLPDRYDTLCGEKGTQVILILTAQGARTMSISESRIKLQIHSSPRFAPSYPQAILIQMSGGQKQRIAIARAMVGNPKVLLLDEATSALDATSERVVQEALDKLMEGRTVVVVAHRLSTIRNADKIVVFHKGKVLEQGSHEKLIEDTKGHYSLLVAAQMGH